MTRYFVAANFWLAVTLFLFVGQQVERSSPTRYSCFHHGWMTPTTYNLLLLFCGAAAAAYFGMTWLTGPNRRSTTKPVDLPDA